MGTEQGAKLKTHPGRKGAKESPGITAAQRGDLQALQQLPAEELLAARDHNGCSALHWAAGNGHLAVCEFLLQLDAAGIAATTWNQRTALHYAARNGRLEVCRWLVAAKSDANALARDEVSPLQLAVWQNHLDTCRWFVEAHADPLQRNRFGCSVAHWLSQVSPDPIYYPLFRASGAAHPHPRAYPIPIRASATTISASYYHPFHASGPDPHVSYYPSLFRASGIRASGADPHVSYYPTFVSPSARRQLLDLPCRVSGTA
ncbi:unnamed protein product [Effrenium voratum]|nr:unnamed protein product [Effrenium voratum]